jgi:signal peptidase I
VAFAAASLDRKVRREAKALVAEARRALAASGYKFGDALRAEIAGHTETLERAWANNDAEAMRVGLVKLDELADEHFARKSTVREYSESIGIAVLIALFLRAFVIEAFKIPSGSMIPTMEIGDHIFVNKFIYGLRIPWTRIKLFEFRKPHRGEVIVFINPCDPDKDFIKRIVALEGDTIEVRCDVLYVNGKQVEHHLVGEGQCSYWDYEEEGLREWDEKECSRYVEVLDGATYETIHATTRPGDDRARARARNGEYRDLAGERDFPRDRVSPRIARARRSRSRNRAAGSRRHIRRATSTPVCARRSGATSFRAATCS